MVNPRLATMDCTAVSRRRPVCCCHQASFSFYHEQHPNQCQRSMLINRWIASLIAATGPMPNTYGIEQVGRRQEEVQQQGAHQRHDRDRDDASLDGVRMIAWSLESTRPHVETPDVHGRLSDAPADGGRCIERRGCTYCCICDLGSHFVVTRAPRNSPSTTKASKQALFVLERERPPVRTAQFDIKSARSNNTTTTPPQPQQHEDRIESNRLMMMNEDCVHNDINVNESWFELVARERRSANEGEEEQQQKEGAPLSSPFLLSLLAIPPVSSLL